MSVMNDMEEEMYQLRITIDNLKQQRDALLAALKQARSDLGAVGCHIGRGRCDAAIAKVKP